VWKPCEFAGPGKFVRLTLYVSNMNGPLIENGSARNVPARQWKRLDLRNRTMMGDRDEPVAIWPPNGGVVRLA
jgi:hypothetical protein